MIASAEFGDVMKVDNLQSLFLGDSYTAGTAVSENLRWPVQVTDRLRACGLPVAAPRLIAGNGWTTADLKEAISSEAPECIYDLVFLLIGVNNQFFNLPFAQFESEFQELIHRAVRFARGEAGNVFVMAIPDYSVTPFAASRRPEDISKEIRRYNLECMEVCRQHGVEFLDTVEISRQAQHDRDLLVADGLHPSEKMYRLWSDFVFANIRNRFSSAC